MLGNYNLIYIINRLQKECFWVIEGYESQLASK
jgi:hypothetical protein